MKNELGPYFSIRRQRRLDHLWTTAHPLRRWDSFQRLAILIDLAAPVHEEAIIARVEDPVRWLRWRERRERKQLVPDDVVREVIHVLLEA